MPAAFSLTKEIFDNFSAFEDKFRTLPILKLPPDNYTSLTPIASLSIKQVDIQTDLGAAVHLLAQNSATTAHNLFTAAFLALLQRHTNQEDFFLTEFCTAGSAGRVVVNGFKSLRSTFDSAASFSELIQSLAADVAHNGQYLDRHNLNNFLAAANTDNEALRSFVVYSDGILSHQDLLESLTAFPSFRIALSVNNIAKTGDITVAMCYHTGLFSADFIESFGQHFVSLLSAAVAAPGKALGAHQLLTTGEWQAIMVDFNNTITPYPEQQTLFGLFEERALAVADAEALRKGNKTITYAALNRRANQVAHFLISKGLQPGDNIGLLVARDFEMIIGMLGILKAGGAYVPIDPDYPIDRQEYIFTQSGLKIILADNHYPIKSLLNEGTFVRLNPDKLDQQPYTDPALAISSKQLAYTIYTSGSTGRPKGVMIEHHSAVNLVLWVNNTFNVGVNDNLLFITSMCFDLSVYDIFGMLAAGGTIVIAEQQQIQDVKQLQQMLIDYKITFWDSVPTTLDYLIRNLELTNAGYHYEGLKTVFMSGDWIPVDLPERIKRFLPQSQVISLGGATEGTVWSNFFPG